jgi:hypothetical protein
MKPFILSIFCLLIATACFAQDNPYAVFGYKPKVQYKTNAVDLYRVANNDKNSAIKFLIFDRENRTIKLLDNRDSVIKTISYTDEDILRWMAVDPYAKKYPSMSPYNYAGNNPIRNIDVHGDSIRTTGSASATAQYKQTAEAGMGGNATMTQAQNGNWTLSALTDDQALNMTPQQASMYNSLSTMISDAGTASFHLVNGSDAISSQILIGDNGAAPAGNTATPGVHTIDMGDIKNMGTTGVLTGQGALMHEVSEGFQIQTKGASGTAAHFDTAIPTESAVDGVQINLSRRSAPTVTTNGGTQTVAIPVTVNGVQRTVTITFTNGNIPATGGMQNNNW